MATESLSHESLTLAEITEQENKLQFTRFTHQDAWDLGLALVEEARRRTAPLAIDITRGGQQLFHAGLPGSSPDNDSWIVRKGRVVTRFGHSSLYMGQLCRDQGIPFEDKFALPLARIAAYGGAFPLTVREVGVIGFVAVSGLPEVQDHRLVVQVVEGFLRAKP
jgi:uncharacterized protein (UPF0303 family)